jgi:hypothetical protein
VLAAEQEDKLLLNLINLLEGVSRNELWASPADSEFLLDLPRSTPTCEGIEAGKIDQLSCREFQVVEHVARAKATNRSPIDSGSAGIGIESLEPQSDFWGIYPFDWFQAKKDKQALITALSH